MTTTTRDEMLTRALAAHRSGDLASAIAGYEAMLAADHNDLDGLHLLAVLRHQQGNFRASLELADAFVGRAREIADGHMDRGNALQGLGRHTDAANAFRQALALAPESAAMEFNLGNALRGVPDADGAVAAYRRALTLAPGLAPAWSNLGATLAELGLPADAARACQQAIEAQPDYAEAYYNLGNALREWGRFDDAETAFLRAFDLSPEGAAIRADTLCNLGLVRFRDGMAAAAETLAHAVAVDASHALARFYLGVALDDAGRSADAVAAFAGLNESDPADAARLDSWAFVKSTRDADTAMHAEGIALLAHAMASATVDGLVLEFGVRHGTSIRHMAALEMGPVHGFDSFLGLPESWGDEPAGVYSTGGLLPDVPENVTLHPGLFEDTLAPFLDAHDGPVRLAHIDCDIHVSTATVLAALAPRLVSGSVLVFDDYLINPTWRQDEHRALVEAAATHGWAYDFVAFSMVGKQAAVRIR